MRGRTMLAAALLLGVPAAMAQGDEAGGQGSSGGLALRAGSGGIVLDYGYSLSNAVDLRVGYAFGSFSGTVEEDDIDYDGDVEFGAVQAMLDYKPFGGGFRISAGAYSSAPEIELVTRGDNEQYQIGNSEYTATGRLDGNVDLGTFAPYVGIGWGGTTAGTGFGLSFDAGVMFADAPAVSLAAQGRACNSTLVACDPDGFTGFDVNDPNDPRAATFRSELEQERTNLEQEIEDLRYWPVVSLGLHYRF